MAPSHRSWLAGFALLSAACGRDSTGATGSAGGTAGTTEGPTADSNEAADETAGADADAGGGCLQDTDCVQTCMAGVCDGTVCAFEPTLTGECRPRIDVDYPPRGATVLGDSGEPIVVVGTVTTGVGSIESFTLGGEALDFDANGAFSFELDPVVGGNTLVFETVDSNGWVRRRVQSFLWSTEYMLPTEPMEGAAPQGLLMYLGQESLDDGDRSPPINDLASVFHLTLDALDLSGFANAMTPMTSQAGYDIYLTSLAKESASVALDAIDGGLRLDASLNTIEGDLVFDCTMVTCLLLGGDGTGGLTMDSIDIAADILITVGPAHEMEVELANVTTQVNNFDIYSNNPWTDFLLSILEPLIIDGVVADIEASLADEVTNTLGPLLADGLGGFSISAPIAFPSLSDAGDEILVQLQTDVGTTDFHDGVAPPDPSPPQGGLIEFRGAGYVVDRVTPYDNLGIPARAGCGRTDRTIAVPRLAPLELGLADDLLNHLLYGAWAGGLLESPAMMGADSGGPITVTSLALSGMLAPTATDCRADGTLLAHIGDLRITASVEAGGTITDFVAHSSMALIVEIGGSDKGITISIPGLAWMETELVVEQDASIAQEDGFRELLDSILEDQLLSGLSGGFGGISLPEIDLSAIAGLPPGSALLAIEVESVERRDGVTVLNSHF